MKGEKKMNVKSWSGRNEERGEKCSGRSGIVGRKRENEYEKVEGGGRE
jgi:hypothetical protein